MNISELRDGFKRVDVEGKVIAVSNPRTVNTINGKQTVADATLEDETGQITLSLWNEQVEQVVKGARVKVSNGFVGTYRGKLQLSVGKYGKLEVVSVAEPVWTAANATAGTAVLTAPPNFKFDLEVEARIREIVHEILAERGL